MPEQKTSSSRPSNSPVLIAVVVIALAGLVGLNVMSNQMRPKSDHEIEAEQSAKSSPAAAPSPSAPPQAASTTLSPEDPNSLVLAGQGNTVGPPDAKKEVVVGFSWTPEVQSDPSKVSKAIESLQKTLGSDARIKVVNVDENQDTPAGVSVGGKLIVPAQGDGVIDPGAAEAVKKALSAAP